MDHSPPSPTSHVKIIHRKPETAQCLRRARAYVKEGGADGIMIHSKVGGLGLDFHVSVLGETKTQRGRVCLYKKDATKTGWSRCLGRKAEMVYKGCTSWCCSLWYRILLRALGFGTHVPMLQATWTTTHILLIIQLLYLLHFHLQTRCFWPSSPCLVTSILNGMVETEFSTRKNMAMTSSPSCVAGERRHRHNDLHGIGRYSWLWILFYWGSWNKLPLVGVYMTKIRHTSCPWRAGFLKSLLMFKDFSPDRCWWEAESRVEIFEWHVPRNKNGRLRCLESESRFHCFFTARAARVEMYILLDDCICGRFTKNFRYPKIKVLNLIAGYFVVGFSLT